VISGDAELARAVNELIAENLSDLPGKERVIKLKTEEIVVEIIRYILQHRLFVERLATNSTYFKDPRLIDIFTYIKQYLGGDLSNKVLAGVANVSEDYVGQYFKMLTGINPQDYIEYQRMERAVHLLRTSKKSIREIGQEVGYKDTAYFCRRLQQRFVVGADPFRNLHQQVGVFFNAVADHDYVGPGPQGVFGGLRRGNATPYDDGDLHRPAHGRNGTG
jgi:AraC-like DNA-binding protein